MRWIALVLVSAGLACGGIGGRGGLKVGAGGAEAGSGGNVNPAGGNVGGSGGPSTANPTEVDAGTSDDAVFPTDAGSDLDTGANLDTGAAIPAGCPTEVTDLTGQGAGSDGTAVAISSGIEHTCVLLSSGTVKCWGDNLYGQLGVGMGCLQGSAVPLKVGNLSGVKAIASGALHTCALLADGTVKCWGEQYGGIANVACPLIVDDPTTLMCTIVASSGRPELVGSMPGMVPGLGGVLAITAGNHQDCALRESGDVRCWGPAMEGELGNGDTGAGYVTTPVSVSGVSSAVSTTAGPFHGCAVLADGTARCWGANESGELGNGSTTLSSLPVVVAGLANATQIVAAFTAGSPNCAACYAFTCALLADHSVKCWGSDQDGELGNGTTSLTATTQPVAVSGLTDAQSLTAAPGKMFAIRADGTLAAWGSNRCGELGDGTTTTATTPIVVAGLKDVVGVAATECTSCAVLSDGAVYCWGDGPLGNGTWSSSFTPVKVIGL